MCERAEVGYEREGKKGRREVLIIKNCLIFFQADSWIETDVSKCIPFFIGTSGAVLGRNISQQDDRGLLLLPCCWYCPCCILAAAADVSADCLGIAVVYEDMSIRANAPLRCCWRQQRRNSCRCPRRHAKRQCSGASRPSRSHRRSSNTPLRCCCRQQRRNWCHCPRR